MKPALIVEIIGLAGAGKTTLARTLCQQDKKVVPGERIQVKNVRYIPFFVRHAFLSLPIIFSQARLDRCFTWDELKKVIYLKGWHRVLKQQRWNNNAVIIIDHGPIFELAKLYGFGPDRLKSQKFEKWWDSMFNQWAHTLDLVVWLDAPEEILIKRIRSRERQHSVKESPTQEACDFLVRYQSAYEYVISKVTDLRDIKVFRVDTDCQSQKDIISQVLQAIYQGQIAS